MKVSKIISNVLNCFSIIIFLLIVNCQTANSLEHRDQIELLIENFFNKLNTLEADFIQVSPSGNTSNGKLYIDLPGKLRIDYNLPTNLLITCKGFWIVIQNRNSKITNNIPLDRTPFSILLENKINFNNQNLLTDLKKQSGVIMLSIKLAENVSAGELILEFSEKPFILRKWIIKDIVGDKTTVLIQNIKRNSKLPFTLFFPDNFPEPND